MISTFCTTLLLLPVAAFPATPAAGAKAYVVSATGVGQPNPKHRGPQARLMARRAAEVTAVRNLARELGRPSGSVLRGFRYTATEYRADGSVMVTVEWRGELPATSVRPRTP